MPFLADTIDNATALYAIAGRIEDCIAEAKLTRLLAELEAGTALERAVAAALRLELTP
jgi:DNA-binding TFAR19-related protein (PDSD5 family)